MTKDDFITIKKTFFNCLLKIALQKIKYIPQEPLSKLVEYVTEEFIHAFT